MALLNLGAAIVGVVFLFAEPDREMSELEASIMGFVFLVFGVAFAVVYAAGPFLPRQSWVWVFGLVLICLGLTSACCLPVCIPLLIHWLKPEMKEFYGRTQYPSGPPPPPPQWT